MSKNLNRSNPSKQSAALKRLADDLAAIDTRNTLTTADEDMLSLIVNEALQGEDVSKRYPAFYRKLLENADLRQAFLDALASIEAERAGELTPLPNPSESELEFLRGEHSQPTLEVFDKGRWHITWERTAQELQALFSPNELAYRSDFSLTEDPWFTLLRGEIDVEGRSYAVVLECTMTSETKDAVAAFVMLAVIQADKAGRPPFPVQARLRWSAYEASVLITQEGRTRFPDIPLGIILEAEGKYIDAGLSLTLENTP